MRDYLSDTGGDLIFESDLKIGESTNNAIYKLLTIKKGELIETPMIGLSIISYLDNENKEDLHREIRKQLKRDGGKMLSISYNNNNEYIIKARYED
ncbi:MAG: hypothetical protein K9J21_06925 [Bacteroidales bacterium]|nr:hypothetical protein [Bacteroidales bacterium]